MRKTSPGELPDLPSPFLPSEIPEATRLHIDGVYHQQKQEQVPQEDHHIGQWSAAILK
ncbi:MAG: hypothetical protein H0X41_03315 [Chitinophagaceae bacterium]|nr:hypothetical protein [Chitinophagaceae bacterium]